LLNDTNTLRALQSTSFNDVVEVLFSFAEAKMFTAAEIAGKTLADVQTVIGSIDKKNKLAKAIHGVCTKLVAEPHNGIVPSSAEGMKALNLDDAVAGLLMNSVYGATDLVIGLNTRKAMVALDLMDWEESGATRRVDVKMAKIPASHIKNSLITWLPTGEKRNFQECIEPLATVIGENKSGLWGSVKKTLTKHFSPKDKDTLLNLSEKNCQFHKSTRCGTAKKRRLRY